MRWLRSQESKRRTYVQQKKQGWERYEGGLQNGQGKRMIIRRLLGMCMIDRREGRISGRMVRTINGRREETGRGEIGKELGLMEGKEVRGVDWTH